ncbi:hypothetical protein ABW19_dt0210617 [Dactylella cylindrospora]|nr:hypothetical protein ABW19_dt0210617 [Dactylella cylindrospora]
MLHVFRLFRMLRFHCAPQSCTTKFRSTCDTASCQPPHGNLAKWAAYGTCTTRSSQYPEYQPRKSEVRGRERLGRRKKERGWTTIHPKPCSDPSTDPCATITIGIDKTNNRAERKGAKGPVNARGAKRN